jgi:hypothetical protein
VFDRLRLVAHQLSLPDLDFNLSGFHRLRHFALQFDLEQAILKRGAPHLDIVGEIEATFERSTGDAAVEVLGLALFLVYATGDRQRVLMNGDADLFGLEAGDRKRNAVLILTGSNDVAGRIMILRFEPAKTDLD